MLQFATAESPRFSLTEQVEMVLKGGISWIRITGRHSRSEIEALMKPCEEAGAILVLDDDVEMVDSLRIHGLHLTSWTRGSVIAAREKLGPHAILGVTVESAEQIEQIKGLDLDYIVIPEPADGNPMEFYSSMVTVLREKTKDVHPVACGDIPVEAFQPLLSTGLEGFQISGEVLQAEDPGLFVSHALSALED